MVRLFVAQALYPALLHVAIQLGLSHTLALSDDISYTELMAPRRYSLNENAFSLISSEAGAYCLGFLLADGWIDTNDRSFSVAVHPTDQPVLDYLKSYCGSSVPIKIKTRNGGFSSGGILHRLTICSLKMTSDLGKLGVVRGKAKEGFLPQLSATLHRHLLRGLFDGDGSVGTRQFWLIGSHAILSDVVALGRTVGADLKVGMNNSYPRLHGSRRDRSFLRWLYDDCEFALSRKLERVKEYW